MSKDPQRILDSVFAFPPNRATLGGTAYLIVKKQGNILVDCPAWNDQTQSFLSHHHVTHLVLTHRQGIGNSVPQIQQALGCQVVIQEQEAYLLPNVTVTSFQDRLTLNPDCHLLWTSGYSPGSACLYDKTLGGILFSGRHILPDQRGWPIPIRTAKTFHWNRQLQSVQKLLVQFTPKTLGIICPGANVGYLRGKGRIEKAYERLSQLDFSALRQTKVC